MQSFQSGHAQTTPSREQHALPPKPFASSSRQETIPRINQLITELETVRRRLAADLRRERDIIQQLTQLSAGRPTPTVAHDASYSSANNQLSTGGEIVLEARLQLAEKQLKEERRRREAAEDSLKDVQRECREPFVVPALMDAFLAISNLASEAVSK
ncbi:hypothetical protein L218DRAFT_604219 [Marasmius fiardii PR-910]|nr:hypothetical protein L218DRAFT_604219 [Marasmius fiardii PR-910]